jgi:DNA-binding transcriptional ArsR family regulator
MLDAADEVCGTELYRAYIPRFSVHIHKLRQAGYVISKRRCDLEIHDHHDTAWLYRLEAVPEMGQMEIAFEEASR